MASCLDSDYFLVALLDRFGPGPCRLYLVVAK